LMTSSPIRVISVLPGFATGQACPKRTERAEVCAGFNKTTSLSQPGGQDDMVAPTTRSG